MKSKRPENGRARQGSQYFPLFPAGVHLPVVHGLQRNYDCFFTLCYRCLVWDMDAGQVAGSLMLATIAAIITYIPSGFLGTKIDRRKAILLGICLVSTTDLLGIILTTFSALVYLSFAIMGVGWAIINVNSLPMFVEMSKVADVGKYTGMYYTASMGAQIVTPILSGFLMELLGFGALFPYALPFSILSLLTMILVRHGDSS